MDAASRGESEELNKSDAAGMILDMAAFCPGVGAAGRPQAGGEFGGAPSSVLSAVPAAGEAAALADKGENASTGGTKTAEGTAAAAMAQNASAAFGLVRGKAKTGAKNAGGSTMAEVQQNAKDESKEQNVSEKCFTGDTLVRTKTGFRPIKEILEGDDIYSRDAKTGEAGFQKVEKVFCTSAHTIYHIWLDGREEIKTTAYHPVYVEDNGWVTAINLREGDAVETAEGKAHITRIEKIRHEKPVTVYNFHVAEWSSYFVSGMQVYVHNGKGHKDSSKSGGAYKNVAANGGERHHIPADSASPLSRGKGPVIRMERNDHNKTASWGHSRQALAYVKKQRELIAKGDFRGAQEMDIQDIRSKYGNKYDDAIKEMLEYSERLNI